MASNVIMLIVVFSLILVGIVGTMVPLVPGIPLIFISIAAYGWYEGFQQITPKYLVIIGAITVLSVIIDYLSTSLGAKYTGSSKKGIWGAFLGTFLGVIFFPPLGILLGPWLGAFIGEYIELQDVGAAIKTGFGTVLGLFSGMIFNLILALIMLISFLIIII
ncbi:MAG: DUF456 domain-containing protein [Syntrophomonadaceae bacterium]|jgi:uncharacterized protein YqgC (DUF456 family)|nr:DUF456 domain-containing protein [Syntrophomonadaceae bacterium]